MNILKLKYNTVNFNTILIKIFSFLLFLFLNNYLNGQQITGMVIDDNQVPLPGVNVYVKGTNIGTINDFDGNYIIEVNNIETDILVFSFIRSPLGLLYFSASKGLHL